MRSLRGAGKVVCLASSLSLGFLACSESDKAQKPVICEPGHVGCPCFENHTCNDGLTCASNLCVNLEDASIGGAGGGHSSGGDTGSGGKTDGGNANAGGSNTAGGGTTGGSGGNADSGAPNDGGRDASTEPTPFAGCDDTGPAPNVGAATGPKCLAAPAVIPGLTGAPSWFSAADGTQRMDLDDPRWAGAQRHFFTYASSGNERTAEYRVLSTLSAIYVTVSVFDDDDLTDFSDAVYFAFDQGSFGLGGRAVEIYPDRDTAPVTAPAGVAKDAVAPVKTNAFYVNWTGTPNTGTTAWTVHNGESPPWLLNTATWRGSPGVKWAISFKIDITVESVKPEHLFLGLRVGTTGGIRTFSNVPAVTSGGINSTMVPTSAAAWEPTLPPGSVCGGISLACRDIGVVTAGAVGNVFRNCTSAACSPTDNVLGAQITIPAGLPAPSHLLRMRARLSDWATPDDPAATWPVVKGTENTRQVNSTELPQFTWNFSAGNPTGTASIDYACTTPDGGEGCPTLSNDGPRKQCLLGTTSFELNFGRAYAVRCLDVKSP